MTAPGEIRAPITGSVYQVEVAVGDVVSAGDVVAILESMKLEIPVEAAVSGRIEQVLVGVGEAIGENDVMFVVGA